MNRMKTLITLALVCFLATTVDAQVKKPAVKPAANAPKQIKVPGVRLKIKTDLGVIIIRLYDETPQHRDNFIKLAKEHFFDSLLFHRVISQFMIQGGDPQSKYAQQDQRLGSGDVGYTLPAEFNPGFIHKKGALSAARMPDQMNPTKSSSGCQFYIVQGKTATDMELNQTECSIRNNNPAFSYTEEQRKIYKTLGGTPFLDMNYTVFGEVESGFEVIDKIASVQKDQNDRPVSNIRMYIEVIK
jgi:cyclophilin family peptidyl-prolyl cis-trans isomerase